MAGRNGNRRDPLAGIVPDLAQLRGATDGRIAAQVVHDPGTLQGLTRLHDVELFLEAARRYRPDAAVPGDAINGAAYESFAAAAQQVMDDFAEFHVAVKAWNAARVEAAAAETDAAGAS